MFSSSDTHNSLQFLSVPGPGNWEGDCGTGKKQSPIDINTANTTLDKSLGTFTLKNYNKKLGLTFAGTNNGHALEMTFPARVYNVSGGGLTGVYTTVQFHFHWGPDNSVGSEHTVNGKEYAAEVRKRFSPHFYSIIPVLLHLCCCCVKNLFLFACHVIFLLARYIIISLWLVTTRLHCNKALVHKISLYLYYQMLTLNHIT